jgi:beta-glucosidase
MAAAVPVGPGDRVSGLLARMTLDEKLSLLHWSFHPEDPSAKIYLPGVPRLGIPELRATDGPAGVTIHRPAIAMPAPVALASTFDDTLAGKYGEVLGREGRAFNQDVIFSPMVNNIRVPQAGRNFETFSEDPLLTARMAAAQVRGIQRQGLMAAVKHYAANTQETNRMGVHVQVDERTLRELELPGFQAAVDAGAAAVMCAYPKVNGEPACGHRRLLEEILKAQWDFRGWVTSDWLATHGTDAIATGLDQELGVEVDPTGRLVEGKYFGAALQAAVERGDIPMSEVDDSARRILRQLDRFGLLDNPTPARPDRDVPGGTRVAQEVAESGAVLLRNQDSALPLDPESTRDIAVIGPTAKTPKVTGLGSSYVKPEQATPPVDAITARLGGRGRVGYAVGEEPAGVRVPDSALRPGFPGGQVFPPGGGGVIYDGTLEVPQDGLYRLAARTTGGNATMRVDGGPEIGVGEVFGELTSVPLRLTAGAHRLLITGGALPDQPMTFDLSWVTPELARAAIDDAVATARQASTAVVFVYDDGAETLDRASLSLPGHQDRLISAVAEANPNTIVVLNTGSSVTMPWLARTRAVLDLWYPGQAGAEATAALLFGDADPGGRLSQTFPAAEGETPVAGDPARFPGVDGTVRYSEGIFSGYRWYDRENVRPLFPFGHGLSYTSFEYRDPVVRRTGDGAEVTLTVRNTGTRRGSDLVQVYLGPSPEATVDQPVRALAGYQKVELAPGAVRRVRIPVPEQALRYWDPVTGQWRLGGGTRAVEIGRSAADIEWKGEIRA